MRTSRRKFIKSGALWVPAAMAGLSGILRAGTAPSLKVAGTARVGSIARPAAGGAPSYLLEEGFEGTGYEEAGWTQSGNTDEDYSTVGEDLKGSQCLRLHTSSSFIWNSFPSSNDVWAHGRLRIRTEGTTTDEAVVFIGNTGSSRECGIWLSRASNQFLLRTAGTNSAASATTYAIATTYFWWLHFVRNGTCQFMLSTTTTRPSVDGSGNVFLEKTGNDVAVTTITLYNLENFDVLYDNVLVDDEAIGDNPNP